MAVLKLIASIYVDTDRDPEEVASTMDSGLGSALHTFPEGDVIHARVDGITPAARAELEEHGLVE